MLINIIYLPENRASESILYVFRIIWLLLCLKQLITISSRRKSRNSYNTNKPYYEYYDT